MNEPHWLTIAMIVAIHDEQLAIHGGSAGLRDHALLESALDRARNKWAYEQAALPELAAAYGYGIARNQQQAHGAAGDLHLPRSPSRLSWLVGKGGGIG